MIRSTPIVSSVLIVPRYSYVLLSCDRGRPVLGGDRNLPPDRLTVEEKSALPSTRHLFWGRNRKLYFLRKQANEGKRLEGMGRRMVEESGGMRTGWSSCGTLSRWRP